MANAREAALKVLYEIENNNAYSNIELNKYLSNYNLSELDKSLITELVYGVEKYKVAIDYDISQISNIQLSKISKWIINILRIGIYQIKYLDKIPESASVNESVKLAKRYGNQGSVKFVNGVLRNYIRNKDTIIYPDKADLINYLSVKYSYPKWIIELFLKGYDAEFTEELLNSSNEVPDLTIRVNRLKCSKDELIQVLQEDFVEVQDAKYISDALLIKSPKPINILKAYKDGLFQVQDESSMLVGIILDPKPGETIIDVCAAPGGKSTHIAELIQNKGLIHSRDIHSHKLKLIEENANRLGINIIKTGEYDATKLDNDLVDKCDRVVVDAPCSGLGIMRRKPDIKWNKENSGINSLTNLQNNIIEISSKYVKKGGILIYSTCTINKRENLDVVNNFLNNNETFKLVDISNNLPDGLSIKTSREGYIQTYPNIDGIDGFFIAKMIRNN